MTHHYYESPGATKTKWTKTIVGHDAVIYEKQLDPLIINLMPNATDTFLDVGVVKLSYIRFRKLISRIIHSLGVN